MADPLQRASVRRKHRHRESPWRLLLIAVVAICAAVLILIPVGVQYRWFDPSMFHKGQRAATGLALESAQIVTDPESGHRMAGTLRNDSNHAYLNVQVRLAMLAADGRKLGTVRGRVERLEAHGMEVFHSGTVPEGSERFELIDINGTPARH